LTRRLAIGALALTLTGCVSPSGTPSAFPRSLSGVGTEPFWNIEIVDQTVLYSSADAPAPRRARLTRRDTTGVLEMSGRLDGERLRLTVRRRSCSDGMSDRSYPFTLEVTLGGRDLHGCAHPPDARSTHS
jgi:uncharacterized membrane protein